MIPRYRADVRLLAHAELRTLLAHALGEKNYAFASTIADRIMELRQARSELIAAVYGMEAKRAR